MGRWSPRAGQAHGTSTDAVEMTASEPITTPAGSTIEPLPEGGYRVCDRRQHCRRVRSLWEAQELVHWVELHHRSLPASAPRC
jgi:hypothetical protein